MPNASAGAPYPRPEKSIEAQLRDLVDGGADAETATDLVLAPYGKNPLVEFAWSVVLRAARNLERKHVRAIEDAAFGPGGRTMEALKRHAEASLSLPRLEFKLPDGQRVEWGKATAAQHEARAQYLRAMMAGIGVDLARHERALKLLADEGVDCLDEVEGWEELLRDDEDAE